MEFTISAMSVQSLGNTHLRPQRPQAANPRERTSQLPALGVAGVCFCGVFACSQLCTFLQAPTSQACFPTCRARTMGSASLEGFKDAGS